MNPILNSSTTQNVIGGVAISATGVAAVIATVRAQFPGLPLWPEGWDLFIGGLFVAFLGALASRWVALTRDPEKKPGGGKSNTPMVPGLVFFLCASLALSGCIGMGPSVMGKAKYSVDFVDTQSPDGTQNTEFHSFIAAPAGEIAKIDPGAKYKWQDGNGEFSVSGRGEIDSTAQSEMITELNKQNVEAFKAGMDSALNTLAPLLGPYLQSKDNRAAIEAASDADLADIVREALGLTK